MLVKIESKRERNSMVVRHAIRIAAILNKHLSEDNCHHSVRDITAEAFEQDEKTVGLRARPIPGDSSHPASELNKRWTKYI